MKRRIVFFMALFFFLFASYVEAEAATGQCGENLTWIYENGILTVHGIGDMTSAPWRDEKDWKNLRKVVIEEGVTSICSWAFSLDIQGVSVGEQKHFMEEGIELPDSLRIIGDSSFSSVEGLKEIKIPDGVTQIGIYAFSDCNYLKKVILPRGVVKISKGLFYSCNALVEINIPNTVVAIEERAFMECKTLEGITIAGVTQIGSQAFQECCSLKKVVLAEGVQKIPKKAFLGCVELRTVGLPASVEEIADSAFAYCNKLKLLNFPKSLNIIGERAFAYCISISNLRMPDGVKKIGKYAFSGCVGLKKIVLPKKLVAISEGLFYDCWALKDIQIPNTVKVIDKSAFQSCTHLKRLVFPAGVKKIKPCHQDCPRLREIKNCSQVSYVLSASKYTTEWYDGKKKVDIVRPEKRVKAKGKRFKITYDKTALKKYGITKVDKLPTHYRYGETPKLPQNVYSQKKNTFFVGWYYMAKEKKYKKGAMRTWYNSDVRQFSDGIKGNLYVQALVDLVQVKKKSKTAITISTSPIKGKSFLPADCIDIANNSDLEYARYCECEVRYATNSNMKNAKYPLLQSHDLGNLIVLKKLEKRKTYYIQYRKIPVWYWGVPYEKTWSQVYKVRF